VVLVVGMEAQVEVKEFFWPWPERRYPPFFDSRIRFSLCLYETGKRKNFLKKIKKGFYVEITDGLQVVSAET
jgi:hypothetical protein